MQETMRVKTSQKFEVVDLTAKVAGAVGRSGVVEGLCTVFVRHATAAIVINENADAGFRHDIIAALDKLFPQGVWQHDKVDDNGAAAPAASTWSFSTSACPRWTASRSSSG